MHSVSNLYQKHVRSGLFEEFKLPRKQLEWHRPQFVGNESISFYSGEKQAEIHIKGRKGFLKDLEASNKKNWQKLNNLKH